MKYYRIRQDKRILNTIILKDFPTDERLEFGSSDSEKLREHTMLLTLEDENSIYPAMLEAPMTMVQDEVWQVISMYEPDIVTKNVSLINRKKKTRRGYKLLLLDRMDCLHTDSEFYKDHSIKQLVLDSRKVKGKEIFRIAGVTPEIVVISMNIAESILRRDISGICLEEMVCK